MSEEEVRQDSVNLECTASLIFTPMNERTRSQEEKKKRRIILESLRD